MSDEFPRFTAFDPASVSKAMQDRFGWDEAEIRKAAEALMPAALAGIRHFGSTPSGFEALMALMPGPARAASTPPQSFVGEPLALSSDPRMSVAPSPATWRSRRGWSSPASRP